RAPGPGRRAKKHPPPEAHQPADASANHRVEYGIGNDDGDDEPDQPLQRHGDNAGQQPERFLGSRFIGILDVHAGFKVSHNNSLRRKLLGLAARCGDIRPDPAEGLEYNQYKRLTASLDVVGPQCPEISNIKPPVRNHRIRKRLLSILPRLFTLRLIRRSESALFAIRLRGPPHKHKISILFVNLKSPTGPG